MERLPLFNQCELADAFALILPRKDAIRRAKEWFQMFAPEDVTDSRGYFLFAPEVEDAESIAIVVNPTPTGTGYEFLARMSSDEKGEFLMCFSDFHLNLLALSSEKLFNRIRDVRQDSSEVAETRRSQMRAIVAAIRESEKLE